MPTTELDAMKETTKLWSKYVTAVKLRDAARFRAEDADRERRNAWKEYYKFEKEIKEMNVSLGVDDVIDDPKPPNAPRKRRKFMIAKDDGEVVELK